MPALTMSETEKYLAQLTGWMYSIKNKTISKEYTFKGFADAMAFANQIAVLAEEEGHHPDLLVSWGKVRVELSTHAIHGLSENDFILAAKIDELKSAVL